MRSAILAAASLLSVLAVPEAAFAQGVPAGERGAAGVTSRGGGPASPGGSKPAAIAHPPALVGSAGQRAGAGNLPIDNGRDMGANRALGDRGTEHRGMDNRGMPGRAEADRANAGQPSTRGAPQLDAAQRGRLRATLRESSVRRVDHPNFVVHTGTIVPAFYQFYSLPSILVDLYPQYSGYDYILVGDEILVIEPSTRRIVDIIPA